MRPPIRYLLIAGLLTFGIGGPLSLAMSHSDSGATKGAKWALDCRSQMDLYALQHKAATPGYLSSIDSFCADSGQKIDDGMAAPDVAADIAAHEATTTTTRGWGAAYGR